MPRTIGPAPLQYQPLRDRPPHGAPQVPLAKAREALNQLAAAAVTVVGDCDDRGDDILRRG